MGLSQWRNNYIINYDSHLLYFLNFQNKQHEYSLGRLFANRPCYDKSAYSASVDLHRADCRDLLETLMRARDEESGRGLTDDELKNQIVTLMMAGQEVDQISLTYLIVDICQWNTEDSWRVFFTTLFDWAIPMETCSLVAQTTAVVMSLCLLMLATHPEIQEKAREKVLSILPNGRVQVSWDDIERFWIPRLYSQGDTEVSWTLAVTCNRIAQSTACALLF